MNDKASQCSNCGEYMRSSNAEEIRNGFQTCIHCGHENEPNRELIELLVEQEYNIEELQKQVQNLAEYALLLTKLGLGSRLTTTETVSSLKLRARITQMAESNDGI